MSRAPGALDVASQWGRMVSDASSTSRAHKYGGALPIPEFGPDGVLPAGIHECTIDEIKERLGSFRGSDRRPRLFRGLSSYVEDVRAAGVADSLIVNGSFVTDTESPNDIDVLLLLRSDVAPGADLPPFQYNARSRRYVRKSYDLDFLVGFPDHASSTAAIEFFTRVKGRPGLEKGVLRVRL